jgi:hypothetical protein
MTRIRTVQGNYEKRTKLTHVMQSTKGEITIKSFNEIKLQAQNDVLFSGELVPPPVIESIISNAVVYLRPSDASDGKPYDGLFGFDYFNDDIRSGEGRLLFRKDYQSLPILMSEKVLKGESAPDSLAGESAPDAKEGYYYIPLLTIFSQETVDEFKRDTGLGLENDSYPLPQYKAKLNVFAKLKGEIQRIEFEYDKRRLSLHNNVITNTSSCNDFQIKGDVTITCLKDLDHDETILIYAYTKDGKKQLAGAIKVAKNNSEVVKKERTLFVPVATNINGKCYMCGTVPKLNDANLVRLKKAKYRSLVLCVYKTGSTLDVCDDDNFRIHNGVKGKYITGDLDGEFGVIMTDSLEVYHYLERLYNERRYNHWQWEKVFCINPTVCREEKKVPSKPDDVSMPDWEKAVIGISGIIGGYAFLDVIYLAVCEILNRMDCYCGLYNLWGTQDITAKPDNPGVSKIPNSTSDTTSKSLTTSDTDSNSSATTSKTQSLTKETDSSTASNGSESDNRTAGSETESGSSTENDMTNSDKNLSQSLFSSRAEWALLNPAFASAGSSAASAAKLVSTLTAMKAKMETEKAANIANSGQKSVGKTMQAPDTNYAGQGSAAKTTNPALAGGNQSGVSAVQVAPVANQSGIESAASVVANKQVLSDIKTEENRRQQLATNSAESLRHGAGQQLLTDIKTEENRRKPGSAKLSDWSGNGADQQYASNADKKMAGSASTEEYGHIHKTSETYQLAKGNNMDNMTCAGESVWRWQWYMASPGVILSKGRKRQEMRNLPSLRDSKAFNVTLFEANKGKQGYVDEYHYQLNDGSEVREFAAKTTSQNYEVRYYREITQQHNPFKRFFGYYEEGMIESEVIFFNNSELSYKLYDKQGVVHRKMDFDKRFHHSFQKIRTLVLSEKGVDIYDTRQAVATRYHTPSTLLEKYYQINIVNGNPIVGALSSPDNKFLIDDKTGKFCYADDKKFSNAQNANG